MQISFWRAFCTCHYVCLPTPEKKFEMPLPICLPPLPCPLPPYCPLTEIFWLRPWVAHGRIAPKIRPCTVTVVLWHPLIILIILGNSRSGTGGLSCKKCVICKFVSNSSRLRKSGVGFARTGSYSSLPAPWHSIYSMSAINTATIQPDSTLIYTDLDAILIWAASVRSQLPDDIQSEPRVHSSKRVAERLDDHLGHVVPGNSRTTQALLLLRRLRAEPDRNLAHKRTYCLYINLYSSEDRIEIRVKIIITNYNRPKTTTLLSSSQLE